MKSELADPLSGSEGQSSEIDKTEEYFQESLNYVKSDHQNGLDHSSTDTAVENVIEFPLKTNLRINKPQKMSSIKIKNYNYQFKEDPLPEDSYLDMKKSLLEVIDCKEEMNINKIQRKEDSLFIKTEVFDYGSLICDLPDENHNTNPLSRSQENDTASDNERLDEHSDFWTKEKSEKYKKSFCCSICNFKCDRNSGLVIHVRTHTGEKPFSCSYCGHRTNRKSSLVLHLRTHRGEKPFSCSSCEYKTYQKSDLVIHLKTHMGRKSLSCSYCGYKTNLKNALMRHVRIHSDEKPFSCSDCDFKTNHSSSLMMHLKSHTGEKTISCSFCDYKSYRKDSLVRHIRTHTGGEKQFSCSYCDYRTDDKGNLVKHVRTHTGEKPFPCSNCDYKASLKEYFSETFKNSYKRELLFFIMMSLLNYRHLRTYSRIGSETSIYS